MLSTVIDSYVRLFKCRELSFYIRTSCVNWSLPVFLWRKFQFQEYKISTVVLTIWFCTFFLTSVFILNTTLFIDLTILYSPYIVSPYQIIYNKSPLAGGARTLCTRRTTALLPLDTQHIIWNWQSDKARYKTFAMRPLNMLKLCVQSLPKLLQAPFKMVGNA